MKTKTVMNKLQNKKKTGITYIFVLFMCLLFSSDFVIAKEADGSDRIIVSMGDSYSSGEGLGDYFDEGQSVEEKITNADWVSHRSKNAWSGQLTLHGLKKKMSKYHYNLETKKGHWYFVAVSGAETKDIKGKQDKSTKKKISSKEFLGTSGDLSEQMAIFDELDSNGKTADYITLTLGGNDLGFEKIVMSLATSYNETGDFRRLMDKAYKQIKPGSSDSPTVRDKLKTVYTDIANRAKEQAEKQGKTPAKLLVAGYPRLFDGSLLKNISKVVSGKKKNEIQKSASTINSNINELNDAVSIFNNTINDITQECRNNGLEVYYVDVESKFKGHGVYSLKPFLNGAYPRTKKSDDLDDSNPISAKSVHPNKKGAEVYRECVQDMIDKFEDERDERLKEMTNKTDNDSWKTSYTQVLDDFNSQYSDIGAVLNDIDKDGIPEMFLELGNGGPDVDEYRAYTYCDGSMQEINNNYIRMSGFIVSNYVHDNYIVKLDYGQDYGKYGHATLYKMENHDIEIIMDYTFYNHFICGEGAKTCIAWEGLTFEEDDPSIDLADELAKYGFSIQVYDFDVSTGDCKYTIEETDDTVKLEGIGGYDAICGAIADY